MPSRAWRRVRGHPGAVVLVIALLAFVSAVMVGCRDDASPGGPANAVRISPVFHTGNVFLFDRWSLDQSGFLVSSTRETWTVVRTGSVEEGEKGVTVVSDQIGSAPARDVLYLNRPTGELAVFGALAAIVSDMGGGSIVPRWDVLVPPGGLDPAMMWAVGVTDSTATDTAFGSFTSIPEYFSAQVNGVPTEFAAYRITVSSQRIQYTFWLTDTPACLPGFHEEPTDAGNGFEAFLTAATIAPQ